MKRVLLLLGGIVAAAFARGDYATLDIAQSEAMADYIRFESRSWAEDATGEGGRLQANVVWTGEHIIWSDLYIPSGVTLTMNPGTVVRFREGTRIKVEDGGQLIVVGEAGNEVVLKGYEDATKFTGIVLQSSAATYSDNSQVIVEGFTFGKYAVISISDTSAFTGDGQALVPVTLSGSRDTAFSFDWVAETNGVAFAQGTMKWNNVSEGTKNIVVSFPDGLPGCETFTVRAECLRCCTTSKGTALVKLSGYLISDIAVAETMADYIPFESDEWNLAQGGDCGRLTANAVWEGEHVITSDLYIPAGVTLTLTANTVVKFSEGTRIKIEDGGTLKIIGAQGNDVVLRGVDGETKFGGIVKMANGTFTDNSYVQVAGFSFSAFANVALNNSETFRSSGLALIPVTVSGSRATTFSIDWVAETNGVPYKTGTLSWGTVNDGTRNISINFGHELDGCAEFDVRVAVNRACSSSPSSCKVKIRDFDEADVVVAEAMADYIPFESREWAEGMSGEGGRLTANTVWEGAHTIISDVYIPAGVTLTLVAGADIAFCEGTRIKIEDGGALNIVGANGNDVIFHAAEGVRSFVGIVKMTNGTYTDNMYVQYKDTPYSNYPYVTVHESSTYRDKGKVYIPLTLSGSTRNQSFNVDWKTDKGDKGTITWNSSSDGTKLIEVPIDATLTGGTVKHKVTLTAARGCNANVKEAEIVIYEFDYSVTENVSLTEGTVASEKFAVNGDINTQPIFLNESEPIVFSGKWQTFDANEAVKLRVSLENDNGVKVLKEADVDEAGEFAFRPEDYPVGHYTLKHEIVDKVGDPLATMSKVFSVVEREDVEMHGGVLTSNEIWKAGMTHVVYAPVTVSAVYTLFIEPGAIVKFMTGTGIDLQAGAALFANAIVFTHINDDTVGGDTLSDGYTVAPPMDAYFLTGNFTFGDDAELRNVTQKMALTGTLNGNKMLSKGSTYRVSGTFTIANGAKLTIPAGTVLKMENKAAIVVNSGGVLNANGTRAAPIVITSINDDSYSGATEGSNHNPQADDWDEIRNNGGTVVLTNANLLYGGYGQYSNQGDAIVRTTSGITTLDSCVVAHSNLRLLGRTGGTMNAVNCVLLDGWWGIDGAVGLVNGVISECLVGSNGGSVTNTVYYNCETYSSSTTVGHCVAYGEVATVQSGMVYADPLFIDPENGDFRIVEGSPCVDAADSAVAPEFDFYGQPRITLTEQTNDVPVVQGQLADIGICEVMPRDVTSDIDLQPVSVRAEEKAMPGQLIFVKWTVSNVGGVEVDGSWRDTISLVSENGLQVTLGDKITTSHIAVGGEVFCSAYFTVPAMAEGKWRLKVNVNSYHDIFEGSLFANNALTSDRTVEISLPSINPTQGATDGVINAGVPKVLKLTFAEGEENRMVHLNVSAGVKVTYGFGFMPRGANASGSITTGDGGALFRVPEGVTDVYVTLESDTTAQYALSFENTKVEITSVSPNTLPSSGQVTLTITGAGFVSSNTVELAGGGKSVVPESVQYVDAGTLVTTIDCAKLAAGTSYDLQIGDGETVALAANAVSVAAVQGKGQFWARLVVPESVRHGRVVACYVEYGNSGNADILAQVVQVMAEGDGLVSLDGRRYLPNIQFLSVSEDVSCGILRSGSSMRREFFLRAGRANRLMLSTSWKRSEHPAEWPSAEAYLRDLSLAATCIGLRGRDGSDFDSAYRLANERLAGFATGAVFGTIRDEQAFRVSGVLLELSNDYQRVSGVTDDAGRFEFSGIQAGTYCLSASKMGLTLDENIEVFDDLIGDCARAYTLPSDGLSVNVRIASTSTCQELVVTCVPISGDSQEVLTGVRVGESEFRIEGVSQGLYEIRATGHDCGGSTLVNVLGDGSLTDVCLRVSTTVAVSGSVEGLSAVDEVAVYASGEAGLWRASPSEDGSFSFAGLVPGDYTFKVIGDVGECYCEQKVTVDADMSEKSVVFSRNLTRSIRLMAAEKSSVDYDKYWFFEVRQVAGHLLSLGRLLYDLKTVPYPEVACPENLNTYDYYCRCRHEFALWIQYFADAVNRYSQTKGTDAAKECAYLVAEVAAALGDVFGVGDKWQSIVSELEMMTDVVLDADGGVSSSAIATVKYAVNDIGSSTRHALETMESLDFQADSIGTMLDKIAMVGKDLSDIYSAFERVKGFEDMLAAASSKRKMNTRLAAMSREFNWQHTHALGVIDKIRNALSLYDRAKKASEKAFSYFFEIEGLRNASNFFQGKYDWYNALKFNGYHDDCENPIPDPPYDPSDVFSPNVPQSYDPNEMAGPLGKGDPETERFVKPGEWMAYTVYFENQSNATAAAQEVTVSNPLSEWLDWSTFEMGEVAFNNQIDLGLVGKKNGTSEVKMNGTGYSVRTELKLDEKTGVADWYLRIVDSTTETGWPEDVFAGFLPPNDETFCGEGHITYRIKVREDAPKGVRIDNSATIVFDYNDPIETDPAWWNTVYAGGEAAFDAEEMKVDEGRTLKVVVNGGNKDLASSVQVLVTYNTAAAADLDLKGATVDGVKPKSFKFPVTLEWAAGEIGEKTVEIPVVVDKAVEADEFLTLELANPMNLEIGDGGGRGATALPGGACTVTIHDPQYDSLKAKVAAGTATKAEADALAKADKVFAGKAYVRGLANDATRGKVTGSALAAAGKGVTLKATANKGYVFAGWWPWGESGALGDRALPGGKGGVRGAPALPGDPVSRLASLVISPSNDVSYVAWFIRPEEDSLELGADFLPGEFAVGEAVSIAVPVESVSLPTVTVSGLPAGLKYYANETAVKATAKTAGYTIPANTIFGTVTAKAAVKPLTVAVTVKNLGGYQIVRKYEVSVVAVARKPVPPAAVLSDAAPFNAVAVSLSDDLAGKVTGAGVYQAGKKVTLKATANKGYVFAGWTKSGDVSAPVGEDADGTVKAATLAFAMPADDVELVAAFVTAEEDRASIAAAVDGMALEPWVSKSDTRALPTNVMAGVYLEWPVVASALSETTVKVSGLPSGLKFTAKPVTAKVGSGKTAVTVTNVQPNTIYGAPTAASKTDKSGIVTPSAVKVAVTTAGKSTAEYQIDLTVDPLPAWAVGDFGGLALSGAFRRGSAAMSVTAAGKVSGKVVVNGTNVAFAAANFDASSNTIGETQLVAKVEGKLGKEAVAGEIAVVESGAQGVCAGATMELSRNVWKDRGAASVPEAVQGLYTVKLGAGERGTGYLSLTVGKDGAVKATGKTPEGVALSGAATLVPSATGYFADLFSAPSAYKGGYVAGRLAWDAEGVVTSAYGLDWTSFDPQATEDYGAGFARTLAASGAWYSKTAPLADYYTTLKFAAPNGEGAAEQTHWGDLTVSVDSTGKKFVVDQKATKPVQDRESKAWSYDGANDAALTFSFTQATGIWKGSFLWWFDEPKHASTKVPFEGVLVLGEDLEGAGQYDVQSSYIPYDKKGNPQKEKAYKCKASVPVGFRRE